MDPNETLRRLRLAVGAILADSESDDQLELAEHFDALDTWLSKGGFLPDDWKR